MKAPKKWFVCCLIGLLAGFGVRPARAQTPKIFANPALVKSRDTALASVVSRLAKAAQTSKGQPPAAGADAAAAPATRFTPSGKRLMLDAFVDSLANSAEEKQGIRQLLGTVFTEYEKAAAQAGHPDDIAAALTFYIAAHYTAYHDGQEVNDSTQDALLAQLQTALATEELRAASREDKQRLYEFFILMGGFTGATRELGVDQKDANLQKLSHQLGGEGLRFVLKVSPGRIHLASTGLSITGDAGSSAPVAVSPAKPAAAKPAAGGAGLLSDISYKLPTGWSETRNNGQIVFKAPLVEGFTEPRECILFLTPGVAKNGSVQNTLQKEWHDLIVPSFEGTDRPFPISVALPGGLACCYSAEEMRAKQNKGVYGVSCYAIDAGNAVVVVTVLYPDQIYGMYANKPYIAGLEQFLSSLTIRGAPTGRVLVTPSELAGHWSSSSTSFASYVDSHSGAYKGDASIATGKTYTFRPDGTFAHIAVGISGSVRARNEENGTFRTEGQSLIVLTDKGTGRVTRFWFHGLTRDDQGAMLVLSDQSSKPTLFRGISQYETRLVLVPESK